MFTKRGERRRVLAGSDGENDESLNRQRDESEMHVQFEAQANRFPESPWGQHVQFCTCFQGASRKTGYFLEFCPGHYFVRI